jgi:hypothetical protein
MVAQREEKEEKLEQDSVFTRSCQVPAERHEAAEVDMFQG